MVVGDEEVILGFEGQDDAGKPKFIVEDDAFWSEREVVEMFDTETVSAEDFWIDVFVVRSVEFSDFGFDGCLKLFVYVKRDRPQGFNSK